MDDDIKDWVATGELLNYRLRSGKLLRDATRPEILAELEHLHAEIQAIFAQALSQLLSQGNPKKGQGKPGKPRRQRLPGSPD
jgi:hypothetical protein